MQTYLNERTPYVTLVFIASSAANCVERWNKITLSKGGVLVHKLDLHHCWSFSLQNKEEMLFYLIIYLDYCHPQTPFFLFLCLLEPRTCQIMNQFCESRKEQISICCTVSTDTKAATSLLPIQFSIEDFPPIHGNKQPMLIFNLFL